MELPVIQQRIYEIRGNKIILDKDLAVLYQVPTKSINLQVKRNKGRFPSDFMFKLTKREYQNLRFQNETSSWGGTRYLPYAFTELGVAMLSSVLNSAKAIQTNISIMRAFVLLRQYAINYKDLEERISKLERRNKKQFKDVHEALNFLLQENRDQKDWKKRDKIGFK